MVLESAACTRPSVPVNLAISSICAGLILAAFDISALAAEAPPDKVLVALEELALAAVAD